MAVINLRDVSGILVAELKFEASMRNLGFHEYCKQVLEHRHKDSSFTAAKEIGAASTENGRRRKRVPDQTENKRAIAVKAVAAIGEEIKPAAAIENEKQCAWCGTVLTPWGSGHRCMKCGRTQ